MKLKLISAVAAVAFLAPMVVSAAWWNPMTWFPPKVVIMPAALPFVATSSAVEATSTQATTSPDVIYKDRVVTNTVVKNVDSPEQAAEIESLKTQVANLTADNNDLKNKYDSADKAYSDLYTKTLGIISDNATSVATMKSYADKFHDLFEQCIALNSSTNLIVPTYSVPSTPSPAQVESAMQSSCTAQGGVYGRYGSGTCGF